MSNAKLRRIGWCGLLLLIVFVGDRALAALLDRAFYQSRFRFALAYTGNLETDLLILGNSRGANSFHQQSLEAGTGLRAANLSFNGMPASLLPVLLEDYLAKNAPPSVIVVEVSCVGGRQQNGSLERFSVLSSRSNGVRELLKQHSFKFFVGTQLSHLLRYNSELMWRSLAFTKKSDQAWAMHGQVADEVLEAVSGDESITMLERSVEDAAALKRLIALAESRSIQIELVFAPYLKPYRLQLDDFDGWMEWLKDEIGQPIADYSLAVDDSSMFADRLHLNAQGSEHFSALIIRQITDH